MIRAGKFVGVLLVALVICWVASADRVILKDGQVVEGTIVLESADRVVVQTATGIRDIPRRQVLKIEKGKSPIEIYKEKLAGIQKGDADARFQLGVWCKENGLDSEARAEFQEAIRIDRDHAGARKALGYVLRGGRWVLGGDLDEEGPAPEEKPAPKEGETPPEKGETEGPETPPEKTKPPEEPTPVPRVTGLTPQQLKNQKAARAAWKKMMAEYEGIPWESVKPVRGSGFELRCNSTPEVVAWYYKALEKINKELARFFQNYKKGAMQYMITGVNIHRNHEEFMEMRGVPPGVGGFFQPTSGNIYAYHGEFGPTGDTIAVLAHEMTHKWERLVVGNWRNMPPWIYEGLAVYFGDGMIVPRKGRAKAHQIPRDRLRRLKEEIREDRYVKISELIRAQPGRGFTGRHYAYAWSVMYWMVNAQGDRGKKIFSAIMSHCAEKRLRPEDFEKYCAKIGGVEGFEERWKKWILELEVPPPGKVKGTTFLSHFSGFEISLPDESWEWALNEEVVRRDDRMGFQVAMKKEKGLIAALSANNPGHLTADAAMARKADSLRQTHEVMETERVYANGYEAFEIHYKDLMPEVEEEGEEVDPRPKAPVRSDTTYQEGPGKGGDDEKGQGKDDEEKGEAGQEEEKKEEPPPLMRYRRVYLATPPHIIIIEGGAPIDEFDKYNPDFEKAIQSILIHFN